MDHYFESNYYHMLIQTHITLLKQHIQEEINFINKKPKKKNNEVLVEHTLNF